ncbi:glycosyltransferase [Candidatus Saccharibacteria bacterium]|nr:glycosyltransferase [Candidatus Saccharibacteria bacterium]
MKKVVFVINSLQNGGAERVVVTQANFLARQGKYKPIIICLRKWNQYAIDKGVDIIYLSKRETFSPIRKISGIFKMRNMIDRELEKIGLENICLLTVHLPLPHIICRFSKYMNKFLFVMHNPHFQFKYSRTILFKKIIKILYFKNKLVCVSNGIKKELVEYYDMNPNNLFVIYNPLDFDRIDKQLKSKPSKKDYDRYILFCGRLTDQKRPDRAVRAFYDSDLYKDYNMVMIGIGEKEDETYEQIKGLGMADKIHLLGWKDDIYAWMKGASALICSSDYESFGMVLVEALYCGCPVVSTNCKYGPDEILVGKLSKYLTKLNAHDLGNMTKKALRSYPNIDYAIFDKFKVEKIVNEYINLYGKELI